MIPSHEVSKHKGTPTIHTDFLSSIGVGRRRHAYSEIKVKTNHILFPPRKYLGEAGWGDTGDTPEPPQKILECYNKKSHAALTHFTSYVPWVHLLSF